MTSAVRSFRLLRGKAATTMNKHRAGIVMAWMLLQHLFKPIGDDKLPIFIASEWRHFSLWK
ncbi:MAG: Uncharacterised protein [Pseudidiomarina mangrovi]|nr:MAG: Uncharacterised protein [Pseudidiomarina mangrovi]